MSYLKFIIFLFFTISNIYAQENWINYVVKKEKGIMSISVDVNLLNQKPNYKNLLIVGSQFSVGCLKNGFPDEKGLENIYTFSDSTAIIIDKLTKNRLAGIITYQCMGLDVFYVKDTINLRKNLTELYDRSFKNTTNHIYINYDKKWDYYKKNLNPEYYSNDFIIDHQYLTELVYDGDDLSQKRNLTHWFYFNSLKKRTEFVKELKIYKFSIDSLNYKKEKSYPYELQASHEDYINPQSISELTKLLKVIAELSKGQYDGWSTEVVKKE